MVWRTICDIYRCTEQRSNTFISLLCVLFCRVVHESHDWVMARFILRHLSKPALLHNHPPLSQHAVPPPPRLSTYEFMYALICFFWSQNVPRTEYATSPRPLMCLPLSCLPALVASLSFFVIPPL